MEDHSGSDIPEVWRAARDLDNVAGYLRAGADTLRFSLNLPTIGRSGQTITLGVFGVDVLGNVGPVVTRRLTIE